jgi:hypothetical protein
VNTNPKIEKCAKFSIAFLNTPFFFLKIFELFIEAHVFPANEKRKRKKVTNI